MAPIVAQLSAILLWLAKSEQWGITATNDSGFSTWVYPLNYPNRALTISVAIQDTQDTQEHISYYALEKNSCNFYGETYQKPAAALSFHVISLGY